MTSSSRRAALLLALGFLWLSGPGPAGADPVLYRFAGTGSGLVDSQTFTGPFAIEVRGDTADLVDSSTSSRIIHGLTAPAGIELPGIGFANFTAEMSLLLSESRVFDVADIGMAVTFADGSHKGIFSLTGTELFGYRLDAPFGPFFDSSANLISQFNGVPTDLGDLSFSSMINITFTATPVPEPSSLGLVSAGLGLLALARRARSLRCG